MKSAVIFLLAASVRMLPAQDLRTVTEPPIAPNCQKLVGSKIAASCCVSCYPQASHDPSRVSQVWLADQGDGTYKNPVLFADYSDPDVTRVGDTFYLVASSFDQVPGLPILESKDLVNWKLVAHALKVQPPEDVYRKTRQGDGVWAPAIRFHEGEFYIFYPDPEYGIYMVKAKHIEGPWSTPKLIRAAKGWIDPCPLWDDDGQAYLINGFSASRSGSKNELVLSRMAPDGESLLDDGTLIIDGHGSDMTLEGPKIYKRGGFYYVFAPAGGVATGYEVVYRSKNIFGPFERKVVLAQGKTSVNGPHQGAWVDTGSGEAWFMHFQDAGAYGRVTHLEPMHWADDWPVIGINQDAKGVGEPVLTYSKPTVPGAIKPETPNDSDEFSSATLGLQWQWQANPRPGWALPSQALGVLRLQNVSINPDTGESLWTTPNILSQKLPGQSFTLTTKIKLTGFRTGDRAGLVLMGRSYRYLAVRQTDHGSVVVSGTAASADMGGAEKETEVAPLIGDTLYFRVHMSDNAEAQFAYSSDGRNFRSAGSLFTATAGVWIGAKLGLFAQSKESKGEHGFVDVDWFRFEKP